jgi:hypothetical protein
MARPEARKEMPDNMAALKHKMEAGQAAKTPQGNA